MISRILIGTEASLALDAEASADWALHPFALVEAAGRLCARRLVKYLHERFCPVFPESSGPVRPKCPSSGSWPPRVAVLAGSGSNGADAMVILRSLILSGRAARSSAVVINRLPAADEVNPRALACRALAKMKVPVLLWDGDAGEGAGRPSEDLIAHVDLVIDGIAGTGVRGALSGAAAEMTAALNGLRKQRGGPLVVSVDLPSGNSDHWRPGMPIVEADAVLAIEPRKLCLYLPSARRYAGIILPVEGLFPPALIKKYEGVPLFDWETAGLLIPPVDPWAYKHERGVVEIRAGSPGTPGAAGIAARGAQAAGAGIVRLVVDPSIHGVLASGAGGIMVAPDTPGGDGGEDERFRPDARLLGPGWGRGEGRAGPLRRALEAEAEGVPLILDADAVFLARDRRFHGNAIITPHPGEFALYSGVPKEEVLADPLPLLRKTAAERQVFILFKGHVLFIVSPEGRMGVVDGMTPALAAGGTGDLLAGFCAAIAARTGRAKRDFDGFACAVAAAALLVKAARSPALRGKFADPLEIAAEAAVLAGSAWLRGA
ncbi:MAG: bifunctional ADP-dependent NAD(P)H-hydrate dehydratase/NAD(P)H-hydrate epimerase [Treponema sp.]|jgi:NAD(P)H-hydrate epimerase|nr:bifunctional ADP-dependent NAD(P)H-hydrate dehydratase/NAD(P)H-hydrate epimerase [Treponema sp.]